MVAATKQAKEFFTVHDLMDQREIGLDQLALLSGVERRVVQAIAEQRYTPSPQQRESLSRALECPRTKIVWGHLATVENYTYPRL